MLPLANDLSVGLNQIVRNVSACQILQSVCLTELHLDTKTHKSVISCSLFIYLVAHTYYMTFVLTGFRFYLPSQK